MQSSRFLRRHFRRYAQALVAVSNYTDYLPKCILLTVIFNRAWKLAFCESFERVRNMVGHVYDRTNRNTHAKCFLFFASSEITATGRESNDRLIRNGRVYRWSVKKRKLERAKGKFASAS